MHAWHGCQRAALWSQVSSSIIAPCGFRGLDSASLPVASTFAREPSHQLLARLCSMFTFGIGGNMQRMSFVLVCLLYDLQLCCFCFLFYSCFISSPWTLDKLCPLFKSQVSYFSCDASLNRDDSTVRWQPRLARARATQGLDGDARWLGFESAGFAA